MSPSSAPRAVASISGSTDSGSPRRRLHRQRAQVSAARTTVIRSPMEIARCSPFLHAQIRAIEPKVIVALGRFAGCLLLGTDASCGRCEARSTAIVSPSPAPRPRCWSPITRPMCCGANSGRPSSSGQGANRSRGRDQDRRRESSRRPPARRLTRAWRRVSRDPVASVAVRSRRRQNWMRRRR